MILSIDPGETTGASIFAGKVPAVTSIVSPTPEVADRLIEWCGATADARGEELIVVVEDQYAKPKMVRIRGRFVPTLNFESLVMLVRSAEIWVVLARLRKRRAVRVQPTVWQAKMHRGAPKELDAKGKSSHVFPTHWPEVYRFEGVPEPENLKLVKASRLNSHIRDSALMGRYQQLYGGDLEHVEKIDRAR